MTREAELPVVRSSTILGKTCSWCGRLAVAKCQTADFVYSTYVCKVHERSAAACGFHPQRPGYFPLTPLNYNETPKEMP